MNWTGWTLVGQLYDKPQNNVIYRVSCVCFCLNQALDDFKIKWI